MTLNTTHVTNTFRTTELYNRLWLGVFDLLPCIALSNLKKKLALDFIQVLLL